ncbi:MAG: hypothetical protein ACM30G_21055 [Micromonosporaceae bacterium]
MRPDEFYIDHEDPVFGGTSRLLNIDLITALRARPVEGRGDVEVAAGLAWLVHDDLERFGTGGGEGMPEPQMREAILALRAVVGRVGITDFNPPFRDYSTFKNHWLRNNCRHSYQARRNLLNDLFDPLHTRLTDLETRSLTSTLADPISPRPITGWARVDAELAELRRHFQIARTDQDYRNVGNDCVIVIEALSAHVYDPKIHLADGDEEPPRRDDQGPYRAVHRGCQPRTGQRRAAQASRPPT